VPVSCNTESLLELVVLEGGVEAVVPLITLAVYNRWGVTEREGGRLCVAGLQLIRQL